MTDFTIAPGSQKNEKGQEVARALTRYECEIKCRKVGYVPVKAKKVDVAGEQPTLTFWVGWFFRYLYMDKDQNE